MVAVRSLCRNLVFSSPEPKAQVGFLITICPLSFVVVVVVNFSHFLLLLQNHWTNFNETWYKASLDDRDSILLLVEEYSSLLNEGPGPFPMGDNSEIAKIH